MPNLQFKVTLCKATQRILDFNYGTYILYLNPEGKATGKKLFLIFLAESCFGIFLLPLTMAIVFLTSTSSAQTVFFIGIF